MIFGSCSCQRSPACMPPAMPTRPCAMGTLHPPPPLPGCATPRQSAVPLPDAAEHPALPLGPWGLVPLIVRCDGNLRSRCGDEPSLAAPSFPQLARGPSASHCQVKLVHQAADHASSAAAVNEQVSPQPLSQLHTNFVRWERKSTLLVTMSFQVMSMAQCGKR